MEDQKQPAKAKRKYKKRKKKQVSTTDTTLGITKATITRSYVPVGDIHTPDDKAINLKETGVSDLVSRLERKNKYLSDQLKNATDRADYYHKEREVYKHKYNSQCQVVAVKQKEIEALTSLVDSIFSLNIFQLIFKRKSLKSNFIKK